MDQVGEDIVMAERVRDEHVQTVKRLTKENKEVCVHRCANANLIQI